MMKLRTWLGVAALAVFTISPRTASAVAIIPPPGGYNAEFTIGTVITSPGVSIQNAYFLYDAPLAVSPSSSFHIPWAQPLSPIGAGTESQSFPQEVPNDPGAYTQFSTLIGTYDSGNGVVLLLNDTATNNALVHDWATLFSDQAYTEANIITALATSETATILGFFDEYSGDFPIWQQAGPGWTLSGTLVGFSGGSGVGSGSGSQIATPEPSTMMSAMLALICCGARYGWRRRRARPVN